MATSSSGKTLPKVLVFDLDGCVWYPEMYQLYGGKPFTVKDDGNLKVRTMTACWKLSHFWGSNVFIISPFFIG